VIDVVYETAYYMIDTIAVDAILSEVHLLAGEGTDHPIEDGSNISDHYRPAPRALQLEGVITDTPIRMPGSHTNGAQLKQQTFEIPNELFGMQLGPIPISIKGAPGQGSVTGFSTAMERVRSTWEEFEAIVEQRRIITIVTSLRTYDNMTLRQLEVDKRGSSYRFNCLAVQQRTVVSGRVTARPVPRVPRALPKANAGKQNPKPAPEADTRSLLASGMDALLK
jgi:hypothetical protein